MVNLTLSQQIEPCGFVDSETPVKLAYKYEDDGDYVFPFSTSYVSRRLKKEVFKPAGLEKITVHDLRRSFASHLTYLGFEVFDVSQIMAH